MQAEESLLNLEIKSTVAEEVNAAATEKQFTAAITLLVSLAFGIVGNLLFYYTLPGINIPLFVGLFTLATVELLIVFKRPMVIRNLIFLLPAVIFSALLSYVSAPELLLFNAAMAGLSLFAALRFAGTPAFLGGHFLMPVLAALDMSFLGWFEGPLSILVNSRGWFQRVQFSHEQVSRVGAVLRGIMFALPILLVFGALLASADAVFSGIMNDLMNWIQPNNMSGIFAQLFLTLCFTWLAMVGYKLLLQGPAVEIKGLQFGGDYEKNKGGLRLSMIESTIILGSIDLMFLTFVLIQTRYLFGGKANITIEGFTYAEYARRGFYELLAVSLMTMILVIALDVFTHRKREKEYLFRSLSITLVALTMVILIAAFRRLNLYEDTFGFTRIRVMSGVFMLWLALLFLMLIRDILQRRRRYFWIGCIVAAMGFVLTLNIINMDGFIAGRNIQRFEENGKLDVYYLLTLSDDAIPALVDLYEQDVLDDGSQQTLGRGLWSRLESLDREQRQRNWLGYHFAKNRAWEALDAQRDSLKVFQYDRSDYTISMD